MRLDESTQLPVAHIDFQRLLTDRLFLGVEVGVDSDEEDDQVVEVLLAFLSALSQLLLDRKSVV